MLDNITAGLMWTATSFALLASIALQLLALGSLLNRRKSWQEWATICGIYLTGLAGMATVLHFIL